MSPRIRRCFLCKRKQTEDEYITLHSFPKDPKTNLVWKQICNLQDVDAVAGLTICSLHFTKECYANPACGEYGGKLRLKAGSYPSISVPRKMSEFDASTSNKENVPVNVFDPTIQEQSTSAHARTPPPPALDESITSTPKKRKFFSPRYLGDVGSPDVSSPKRAKRSIFLAKDMLRKKNLQIRALRAQNRRLNKKIVSIKGLLNHLRKKDLISEETSDILCNVPENLKEAISRKLKNSKSKKYSPHLRSFALTLQFYSAKAYDYVRKTWNNLLPHPSTLRKWYSVVDGRPGFTREAFHAISLRNSVIVNIVIDEMSIRQQITFNNNFHGFVDLGTQQYESTDNSCEASSALVFMAVAVNSNWKVPLGYFLIKSLTGRERANILTKCFELLHEAGAKVFSITFDGAAVNFSMCNVLGASFDYFHNFKPWFLNPITNEKIFVFLDPCHMIKLVRNCLGDKKLLKKAQGEIKWSFLELLVKTQSEEGLHAATKLTKKHIQFENNRMKVKLAVQVLSESVCNALKFLSQINAQFANCLETANFCYIFNSIFDLLNCRNKFARKNKYNIPLSEESFGFLKESADLFISYICDLKDEHDVQILKTNRKTGFLGLIVCLTNIFELFEVLKSNGQKYLLSFKISQDYIETFFSAIRSRGGFNDNPNAQQLKSAYKRLLVRHELKLFENSNCLADSLDILHVSCKKENLTDSIYDHMDNIPHDIFDHDYVCTMWTLSSYVDNVVEYIGGFIVSKIMKVINCPVCLGHLSTKEFKTNSLISIKNRGTFIMPSSDVCAVCKTCERVFRQNICEIFVKKNIRNILATKIFAQVGHLFSTQDMDNHIKSQSEIDNHKVQLIKLIIELYIKIRLFHEAKVRSEKNEYIRHRYTKLIHFKHQ